MVMNRNEQSSFGALLKAFRTRRHLTQQQLSIAVGAHRNAIGRWERGDMLPASKTIVLELAKPLHLDDQETRQLLEASLTAISPYWHVPLPRNPFFTGREEMLEVLHRRLHAEQMVALTQTYALHGLGGVGKTQIALEYAYRHALEYSAVFWVGAETEEQIISSLLHISEALQLPGRDDKDQQRVVAAAQRWLMTHKQWLLIWDNLEDLALLDRFLPPVRQGAILITTRCQALGTHAQGLDLLPMEHEEGMLFVLRRAKVLESTGISEHVQHLAVQMPLQYAATDLVEAVGGLPLALDQAGAYIEETQCSLPAYLDLFRTRRAALLQQRGEGSRDHPASVSTTFTLAITATAGRHPAVWDLLQVCALIQPDAIPEELFRQGARHLGETLEAVYHDELEWNRVVSVACSYSLLHRQPEEQTLSMHRLVQVVLQDFLSEEVQYLWRTRVLRAMSQLFPADEKMQADYWQSCERLLSLALVCLTWSELRGEAEALYITLTIHVATYLSECSRYAEAEALYLRAVRLGEQSLGTEHLQVGEALHGLANLSRKQGKYIEAEALYLRAVRLGEQTLGAEHPQVATSLHGLASFYSDLGKYAEAKPLYQRALNIREHTLGADHPQVAVVLYNLAEDYREQGRYEEAEPLFQRALHIWEQALGSEHRRVAESLNGLAILFQEQGRYVEAEALFQRALQIRELHLGQQHPETAQTLYDLAVFRQKQGNLDKAIALAERAFLILSQSLGVAHSKTIATRTLYTQLVQEQERLEAEEAETSSRAQTSSRTMSETQERLPTHTMRVAVRGATEQVAYTRKVKMREVTFTCTLCGQTVTQLHYPSGWIKYCSEACRAVRAAQRQEERVAKQREKRRTAREARLHIEQQGTV